MTCGGMFLQQKKLNLKKKLIYFFIFIFFHVITAL